MTDRRMLRAEAARARAGANGEQRTGLPCGEAKREDVKFRSEFRAETVERNGQQFYLLEGYASMTEKAYEMWDFFGPYDEVVSKNAFDETLAADPMVVYRFNHGGTSMANTRNGRLELWADSLGLGDRAWLNPQRDDVQLLMHAVEDQDVTEQSFMFMIEDGSWNEDFTEFRIDKVNLDRGDVGPVTYGANPHTLVAARAGELLAAIPNLPPLAAREAYTMLAQRKDVTALRSKIRGIATRLKQGRALDPQDVNVLTQALGWFSSVDMIVDEAQDILSDYLGVPNPDLEPPGDTDETALSAPMTSTRAERTRHGSSLRLALAQLELDKQHQ